MTYIEFRKLIHNALQTNPNGLTWKELKDTLNLSYKISCQTWIYQLEDEIQLVRTKGRSSAYIWKIDN